MDPIGKKLLDIAKDQLGYQEKDGGYTKFGDWYGKKFEGGDDYYSTAPWCDMFLAWAAHKAGVEDSAGTFAATIEHARWFEKKDAWGTEPEPGAIVFFAWSGSKDIDAISHVGIVERVEGSTVHTIEANTDGVHLKRQERDPGTIVGYGYPAKVEVPAQAAAEPSTAATAPRTAAAPRKDASVAGAATAQKTAPAPADGPPVQPDALLGGLLAVALCGTAALAVGRSGLAARIPALAAMLPSEAPIRMRKRGRHHKTPVALPADVTPADLDAADAGTAVFPALSAATAADAEDREFWSRVSTLQDDEELAFWSELSQDLTPARPEARV